MAHAQSALVVEAEFIIALGIQSVLESMDFASVEIARDSAEARARIETMPNLAVAVIGLEAGSVNRIQLAADLHRKGIVVVGLTADSALGGGVADLPNTPILLKPVPDEEIVSCIRNLLGSRSS